MRQTQTVPPETRYAKSGDVRIAYQVVGEGPFDLVYVPGAMSHVDLIWDDPARARYFGAIAEWCRLILFDKRGTGASDLWGRRSRDVSTMSGRSWTPPPRPGQP